MVDLEGKRALVCGSTQGIGRACALELAHWGASVTLAARSQEALDRVQKELATSTNQAHANICQDFSNPDALQAKVADHVRRSGTFHILVNNTGGPAGGPILDAHPDAFRTAFSNHVICNQLLVQTLAPGMKEAGYGRIINIISSSVKTPLPGLGVSNTIRGAVASWAKTLAGELGPFGITVNNILPGFIETGRIYDVINDRAAQAGKPATEIEKAFINQIPAGRFGEPKEVAAAVCFLASPAGSYVNGINLPVDGGRTPAL